MSDLFSALGGLAGNALSGLFGNYQQKENRQSQENFAKNTVKWRVQDAREAGINPLVALGANVHSFTPQSVGTPDFSYAGQDLGKALSMQFTSAGKKLARTTVDQQTETLNNMRLQNQLLQEQIKALKNPPAPTADPGGGSLPGIPGQSPSVGDPSANYVPTEVNMSMDYGITGGIHPKESMVLSKDGSIEFVIQEGLSEQYNEGGIITQFKEGVTQIVDYINGNLASVRPDLLHRTTRSLERQKQLLIEKNRDPRIDYRYSTFRQRWIPFKKEHKNDVQMFTSKKHSEWYKKFRRNNLYMVPSH